MERLIFFLSGEHHTLPISEALASIEAEGFEHEVDEKFEQVLITLTKADPKVLSERIGMSHWIGEHFCTSIPSRIREVVGSTDLIDNLPHGKSIAVRIKRVKRHSSDLNTQDLAKKIADQILEEIDYKVDLTNPDNEIIGVLTDGKLVLGLIRAMVDRAKFEKRKPPERNVVHPGTISPIFARALVNLARTPREGIFLDPFCGIGGILIEAGLIGSKPVGRDIKPEMIQGAEKNLKSEGLTDFQLFVGDARKIEFDEEIDAIATDPPYGHQATTGGSELQKLYEQVMPKLARALKPRRYLCITAPSEIELVALATNAGLKLEDMHEQRVHKSLTRGIYVFQKPKNAM